MKLLKNLAKEIREQGGELFLVGGSVRDKLLNIKSKDIDLEVYKLQPNKLESILKDFANRNHLKINLVGQSFAIYKVGDFDIALPRREIKTGTGHRGFEVIPDPYICCMEASVRRDFTINAMLQYVSDGEILDYHNGLEDLKNKVLRAVDKNTFVEDSLRVLRAAQFASRFGFSIDNQTVELCRSIDLKDLPKERIWGEVEKLLLKSNKPSQGLFWLEMLGATQQLFPELNALVGVEQDVEWHPEGTVDTHTALVIDRARELIDDLPYPKKVTVMLAALCHDLGKAVTTEWKNGRLRAHGHASAGVPLTEKFLDRLNIHTLEGYDVREQVLKLVEYHLSPAELFKTRARTNIPAAIRRLANKVELDLLYRVSKADSLGRNYEGIPVPFDAECSEWFIQEARKLKVEEKPVERIFKGRHLIELGYKPSSWFGEALGVVYEAQLEGKVNNLEEAKEFFKKEVESHKNILV